MSKSYGLGCLSKCENMISFIKCSEGKRVYIELPGLVFMVEFTLILLVTGVWLVSLLLASLISFFILVDLIIADDCRREVNGILSDEMMRSNIKNGG